MAKILTRLFRRPDIWFTYDLNQGDASTIKIHKADWAMRVVLELASVFFHMNSCNSNLFFGMVDFNINISMLCDREFVLGYLVSLGKVRVKVILAGKSAHACDRAVRGKCHTYRIFDHLSV
jgi:hypothetical protein